MAEDEELRQLQASLAELEQRVSDLEQTIRDDAATHEETEHRRAPDATEASGAVQEDAPAAEESSLPALEFALGIKALGIAGSAALVLAMLFFVQLAIERGYLGALGRVLLGTASGLVMYLGGRYASTTHGLPRWGKFVAGTGFIVAYIAMYAMTGFASYREAIGAPTWLSLGGIGLLVLGVLVDSLHRRDGTIAGSAVVLGYLAVVFTLGDVPAILSAGYMLGLTVVLVGTALIQPWRLVFLAGVSAGYVSLFGWVANREVDPTWLDLGLAALVFSLVVIGIELLRRGDPNEDSGSRTVVLTAAASTLNALAGMLFIGRSLGGMYDSDVATAIGVLAVGVVLVVAYVAATEIRNFRAPVEPLLTFIALGVAVGVLADDVTRVLVLAIAAMVAILAARRLSARTLPLTGHLIVVLLFLDAIRIVYVGGSIDTLPVTETTAQVTMFAVLIACYYGMFGVGTRAYLADPDVPLLARPVSMLYAWMGVALLALLFEIVTAGVTLSAAWGVLGFVVIAAGVLGDVRQFRLQGLGLLGVTTLKVFLVDTAGLDPVPRILSFLALGVVLLASAYIYARRQAELDVPLLGGEIE